MNKPFWTESDYTLSSRSSWKLVVFVYSFWIMVVFVGFQGEINTNSTGQPHRRIPQICWWLFDRVRKQRTATLRSNNLLISIGEAWIHHRILHVSEKSENNWWGDFFIHIQKTQIYFESPVLFALLLMSCAFYIRGKAFKKHSDSKAKLKELNVKEYWTIWMKIVNALMHIKSVQPINTAVIAIWYKLKNSSTKYLTSECPRMFL